MNYNDLFKALSDPVRLKIIDFLSGGEKCACKIVPHTKKSQPNVSLHLKILKNAGIIKSRKVGRWVHYSLAGKDILKIISLAKKVVKNEYK